MHKCNGVDNCDCDNCRNRHCEEWTECDICHEEICERYYHFGDCDYHKECFDEEYGRDV